MLNCRDVDAVYKNQGFGETFVRESELGHICVKPRCSRCHLHEELCICADIPNLETRTRLVLVMHAGEQSKPTNTGGLACLCLPNSEMRIRGQKGGPPLSYDGLLDDECESWLLHLSDQAMELTPELALATKKPVRLIVPDGTWSQASRTGSKMAKELPLLRSIKLRAVKPSIYRLRSEHHPDGMATFEAIAQVLGILEGEAVERKMMEIFRKMTDRVLWTRGRLPREEVYGGIPGRRS